MDKELLTAVEAIALLPDGDSIHVFLNPGGMLIGADWSRESIHKLIADAESLEVGGDQCIQMGHGLVAKHKGRHHFIESLAGKARGK